MTHIKCCEFLRKPPVGQYKKIHDFLTDMWEDMVITVGPDNTILFHKNGNPCFAVITLMSWLVCDHHHMTSLTHMKDVDDHVRMELIKLSLEEYLDDCPLIPIENNDLSPWAYFTEQPNSLIMYEHT